MLTAGVSLTDGTILIAGLSGTLLVSRDKGGTFTLRQQTNRKGISNLVQAGDGMLITIGENGVKRVSVPR